MKLQLKLKIKSTQFIGGYFFNKIKHFMLTDYFTKSEITFLNLANGVTMSKQKKS